MAPGVSSLESQPVREAAVGPNLERVVAGIPGGLSHGDGGNTWQPATGIDQVIRIRSIGSNGLGNCKSSAGNNFIPIQRSFDVQSMVSYVRGFDHYILYDFPRDGQVPLPALRRTEVLINGIERRGVGKGILQPGIDGIETAEGRTIIERNTASSPTLIDRLSPGRVAAQEEHASHSRSAQVASAAEAKCGLAITKDVPGQAHAW